MAMAPLTPTPRAVYRVQEFAALAGVTVRALHHYDRLGLLKPTARSRAGHRLYRQSDVPRLERIIVLKYLGLPLTRIGQLLGGETRLPDVLREYHHILENRRRRLGLALETLGQIERSQAAGGEPDWSAFATSVRDAEADRQAELRWKKHGSAELMARIRERRLTWRMTLQDYELARDVRAAIDRNEPPTGPLYQTLAARWRDTMERFTEGDPEMRAAVFNIVSDWGKWTTAPLALAMRDFFIRAMTHASPPASNPSERATSFI